MDARRGPCQCRVGQQRGGPQFTQRQLQVLETRAVKPQHDGAIGAQAGYVVHAAQRDVVIGQVGHGGVGLLDDLGEFFVGCVKEAVKNGEQGEALGLISHGASVSRAGRQEKSSAASAATIAASPISPAAEPTSPTVTSSPML